MKVDVVVSYKYRVKGLLIVALVAMVGHLGVKQEVEIEWAAAESCPTTVDINEQVSRLVTSSSAGGAVLAKGRVRERFGGYELELSLVHGTAVERHTMNSNSCDELGWLFAQIVAGAIDPAGFGWAEPSARHARPEPAANAGPSNSARLAPVEVRRPTATASALRAVDHEQPEQPEQPDERESVAAMARAPVSEDRPLSPEAHGSARGLRAAGLLLADVGAHGGLLSGLGVVPGLRAGVGLGVVRVLGGARGWFGPSLVADLRGRELHARISGWSVVAETCLVPRLGRVLFPSCLEVSGGQLIATGIRESQNEGQWGSAQTQAWASLGAGVSCEWWLGPGLGLFVGVAASMSVLQPSFHLVDEGSGETFAEFRTPLVQGRVALGLIVRLRAARGHEAGLAGLPSQLREEH